MRPYRPPALFGPPEQPSPQTTKPLPQPQYQLAMAHRVAQVVKCLRGDLAGDYVRTAVVLGEPSAVLSMAARVPPDAVSHLLSVLRLDFVVDALEGEGGAFALRPRVTGACPACGTGIAGPALGAPELRLEVRGCGKYEWQQVEPPRFDVDLLAVDSDKLYLRRACRAPALLSIVDRLSFVMSRVLAGRFCLLEAGARGGASGGWLLRSAHALLSDPRREWVMDDALAPASWVAARWSRLTRSPETVRTARRRGPPAPQAKPDDVCALCQEPFAPTDVVANLSCSHNFHVVCHGPGAGGGLSAWLDTHDTCPCCRDAVT
jgi:hypothetical protein